MGNGECEELFLEDRRRSKVFSKSNSGHRHDSVVNPFMAGGSNKSDSLMAR